MSIFTEVAQENQLQEGTEIQKVADVIIKQLQLWDVKRIYGVIGDAIFGLMEGLSRQNDLEWIGVKHESVAAMMASAEAKLTGRIGVCCGANGTWLDQFNDWPRRRILRSRSRIGHIRSSAYPQDRNDV
ncbi:thiamine pyrophosphate-binding protein [Paenibacillus alvei]|uniref:thiamine pyrophosphate-binding protein n=1 Tax=Paenibacillus alvei TaxID=44250 RepID=UPI003D29E818